MGFNLAARFSIETTQMLLQSGWYDGRKITDMQLERWYAFKYENIHGFHKIIPSAFAVLREFGGLYIEQDSPGISCYRESIWIDPLMTKGLHEGNWSVYEWLLEENMFPLGVTGHSRDNVLCITNSGKVLSIPHEGDRPILREGNNFDEALDSLIRGIGPSRVYFEDYNRKFNEAIRVQKAFRSLFD